MGRKLKARTHTNIFSSHHHKHNTEEKPAKNQKNMRTKRGSHTAVCQSVVSKDPKFLLEARSTSKNPDKCKPEAGGRDLVTGTCTAVDSPKNS